VGLNEARDIEEFGGFRTGSLRGYEGGKWFATAFEDAVRWGHAFQRFPHPRPFRIAQVWVAFAHLSQFVYHERWDAIGAAYFVREDQLVLINESSAITIFEGVYDVEIMQ
jgi:hypothetical protein